MFFKVIAILIEVYNWFRIVLSPVVISLIIAAIIYNSFRTTVGMFFSVLIIIAGFVFGFIWAAKVWKKEGATFFMSRLNASSDIDEIIKPKDKKITKN